MRCPHGNDYTDDGPGPMGCPCDAGPFEDEVPVSESPETTPERTYVVTQPIRGYRTVIIEARSARDAVERAYEGEGEAADSTIEQIGRGFARLDR